MSSLEPGPRRGVAALLGIAFSLQLAMAGEKERTLDVYWIDSQGGGSTLMVTPAGESILFDAGNPGGRDSGRILSVARGVAGLERIDHLVTTHLHTDHYGGAPEVAAAMPIGIVHDNGIPDRDPDGRNDPSWAQRIRGYREMRVDGRKVVVPGGSIALKSMPGGIAPLRMTFVAARQKLVVQRPGSAASAGCPDPRPRAVDTSDNANSIVTLVEFGAFRMFHGGDLTWNSEAALVCPVDLVGRVDVYQVNHHGLEVSSNPMLLRALAPVVAVFNNGPTKGCHPEVVGHLRGLPEPPTVFQVHRNQKSPEANAPEAQIANGRAEGGQFLRMVVEPDGIQYRLEVPSTGHVLRFRARAAR